LSEVIRPVSLHQPSKVGLCDYLLVQANYGNRKAESLFSEAFCLMRCEEPLVRSSLLTTSRCYVSHTKLIQPCAVWPVLCLKGNRRVNTWIYCTALHYTVNHFFNCVLQ